MESCGSGGCLCSGNSVEDTNKSVLNESTIDFYKVKEDDFTHYCFEGIYLKKEEIINNINVGQGLLQKKDRLVVSSQESIQSSLKLKEGYIAKECLLEDNIFYTVIQNQKTFYK